MLLSFLTPTWGCWLNSFTTMGWSVISMLIIPKIGLLKSSLHGATLKKFLKASTGTECTPTTAHVTPQLHKLHWVPIWLLGPKQSAGFNPISPSCHRTELSEESPLPDYTACPIKFQRVVMLQVPLIRHLHLVRPRKHSFSTMAPVFWKILSVKIRLAPFFVLFCKILKSKQEICSDGSTVEVAFFYPCSFYLSLLYLLIRYFILYLLF